MENISFIGTPKELMEYLGFCEWVLEIAKGFKVVKIFPDLSGFVAE